MGKLEGGELDGDRRNPMGIIEGSEDDVIERYHSLYGNGMPELNFPSQLLLWNQECIPTGIKKIRKRLTERTFGWTCSWNGGPLPRPCRTVVPLSGSRLLCCDFWTPHPLLPPRLAGSPLLPLGWDVCCWRNNCTINPKTLGVFWLDVHVTFVFRFDTLTLLPYLIFGMFLKIIQPSQSVHEGQLCPVSIFSWTKMLPKIACQHSILYVTILCYRSLCLYSISWSVYYESSSQLSENPIS